MIFIQSAAIIYYFRCIRTRALFSTIKRCSMFVWSNRKKCCFFKRSRKMKIKQGVYAKKNSRWTGPFFVFIIRIKVHAWFLALNVLILKTIHKTVCFLETVHSFVMGHVTLGVPWLHYRWTCYLVLRTLFKLMLKIKNHNHRLQSAKSALATV